MRSASAEGLPRGGQSTARPSSAVPGDRDYILVALVNPTKAPDAPPDRVPGAELVLTSGAAPDSTTARRTTDSARSTGWPPRGRTPTSCTRQDGRVKTPPESTKTSLTQRLSARAAARWPALASVEVRFRANFAYVDGRSADGTVLKLCRLRYGGSADTWGFALYRASHDDYEANFLPNGTPLGTPEEALDCACGLYFNDPSAWLPDTSTN